MIRLRKSAWLFIALLHTKAFANDEINLRYYVRPGDCLSGILHVFGVTPIYGKIGGIQKTLKLNKNLKSSEINFGEIIVLPITEVLPSSRYSVNGDLIQGREFYNDPFCIEPQPDLIDTNSKKIELQSNVDAKSEVAPTIQIKKPSPPLVLDYLSEHPKKIYYFAGFGAMFMHQKSRANQLRFLGDTEVKGFSGVLAAFEARGPICDNCSKNSKKLGFLADGNLVVPSQNIQTTQYIIGAQGTFELINSKFFSILIGLGPQLQHVTYYGPTRDYASGGEKVDIGKYAMTKMGATSSLKFFIKNDIILGLDFFKLKNIIGGKFLAEGPFIFQKRIAPFAQLGFSRLDGISTLEKAEIVNLGLGVGVFF